MRRSWTSFRRSFWRFVLASLSRPLCFNSFSKFFTCRSCCMAFLCRVSSSDRAPWRSSVSLEFASARLASEPAGSCGLPDWLGGRARSLVCFCIARFPFSMSSSFSSTICRPFCASSR